MEYTSGDRKSKTRTHVYCGASRLDTWDVVERLNRQNELIAKLEGIMREQDRLLGEAMQELGKDPG